MFDTNIKSMLELIRMFPDEQSCIKYLEQIRWNGEPVSPFDEESKVYRCTNGRYKCKNTGKYFNVRTGTMYDNTKIELQKWFLAVWLVTVHKKGISSLQLGRDLDITQKSAWFMLQRIRACFGIENYNELDGIVEADESFYGGKNKNRHRNKKAEKAQGRSFKDKVPVLGLLEREGKLTAIVIPEGTGATTIQPLVKKYVKPRATFISDDWKGYIGLENRYDQYMVKHSDRNMNYSHPNPDIHTNNIEGAWKIMKNALRDNYNNVSRKHIQKYVDEFVYRFNMRKSIESDKFNWLLFNSGVRTKYVNLING